MTFNPHIAEHIVKIIARLQDAGFEAYIVGGAVRDFLLGRQPKDYDISTSATPEQIKKLFRDFLCVIIGRRFRLVHLHHGKDIIEISTFRKLPTTKPCLDDLPKRAAHAPENMIFQDNEFGTAEEDSWRRDFTVNAIFYDPVNDKLIDFTRSGLRDIESGTVRIIGDPMLRLVEDPVRILRALKLVGQYGFTAEPETASALQKQMPLIVHAAQSRMTLELEKIIKNPYGDKILRTFHDYGFLKYFLPYLEHNFNTPQGQYAMDMFRIRNERMLRGQYRDSISLVLAIFTLPFAEQLEGKNPPGGLWAFHPDVDAELRRIIGMVFYPHVTTKRAAIAAIRSMSLQTLMKESNLERCSRKQGYSGARELAIIQNQALWNIPDYEEKCPVASEYDPRKNRRRYRRPRRQNAENRPPHNHQKDKTAG